MVTFEEFYNALKLKVVTLLKQQEIDEGNLKFEQIVGDVLKEFLFNDLSIKRRMIVPRDEQNYPVKRILYRDDSKTKIDAKNIGIK